MTTNHSIMQLLIAALILGASSVFAHDPKGHPDPMVTTLEPLKGAEFEQTFLQEMIQHHRGGIEMAKLVSSHTQRPELQQFAAKMISMQQAEIEKMTGWLKEWHHDSPKEAANAASHQKMQSEMAKLQTRRDAAFDESFLDMMSQHHDSAVEMAEQAGTKATHDELKQLAAKMAKDQREEIKQLKSWGKSWFGPV